jgi:hypothetical protein
MPEVNARIDERFDQFGLIRCHDTLSSKTQKYNEHIRSGGILCDADLISPARAKAATAKSRMTLSRARVALAVRLEIVKDDEVLKQHKTRRATLIPPERRPSGRLRRWYK